MAEGVELEFSAKTKRIGVLIAVMATVLALSEAAGQNAQADAIRETVEASDLWAFFQAKTIRMTTLKANADMLELQSTELKPGPQATAIAKTVAEWRATAARYDSEPDHFTTYVDGILARGAAGVADYLERYVYAPASHADYLALFGEPRRADAAARARMLTT